MDDVICVRPHFRIRISYLTTPKLVNVETQV